MFEDWSFGRKIGVVSGVMVALTVIMGAFAIVMIQDIVRSKDLVIDLHRTSLASALRLDAVVENHVNANRGYMVTRDSKYLLEKEKLEAEVDQLLRELRGNQTVGSDLVTAVGSAMNAYKGLARVEPNADGNFTLGEVEAAIIRARPARQSLASAVDTLIREQEKQVEALNERAATQVRTVVRLLVGLGISCSVLAIISAIALTRVLGRQLNTAIHKMRNSSAELQAAAGQQASGLREQATAMTEVNTTINELQATSRQIAESAKRVAQIAFETAAGARQGTAAVTKSKTAIEGISKQVDQIVTYMLELGRKSQHIGAVLDLVSELSEQTNILAINATIEATGAGDSGRRFLVVADEIRKLADRVNGSTKEVRALIEDVRGAVNTTVMATETGAKAVEAGSRQFEELTQGFTHIVGLVAHVTEAAREIELSTMQQASAVEQVNIAVASVAQATREGEASSSQTLQTAIQLTSLTRDLGRIMRVGAVG
jgi:methyl-accepting chemotaxis protein